MNLRSVYDSVSAVLDGYLDVLREDGGLLFNVRKMCCYSGAAFCHTKRKRKLPSLRISQIPLIRSAGRSYAVTIR